MKPIPILAALLFATPAFANPVQTNTGNSASQAQVYGSGSAASSAQQQHQAQHQSSHSSATTGPATATGGTATGGSANVSNNVVMGGSGSSAGGRVGPTVFVPDGTGQAPCGGGVGLGAGAMSAGGAGGGTLWEFGDCKRMRELAALRSLAVETGDARLQQAALNELCQIDRIRDAFGGQCPLLGQHMPVVTTVKYPYDWCYTRDAGNKHQREVCEGKR